MDDREDSRTRRLMRLQQSAFARRGMTWANRCLRPLAAIPISVRGHRLHPPTFDRRLAAEFSRWSRETAAMLDLWAGCCHAGTVAIDVGANLGLFALEAARAVGPEGAVIAVEPAPRNADAVARAIADSGRANLRLLRAAAVDRNGPIEFGLRPDHGGDHRVLVGDEGRTVMSVPGVRLDDEIDPHREISAIKLDVQGAEGLALAGLSETLSRSRRLSILMEFWPAGLRRLGTDPLSLLNSLEDLGYRPRRAVGSDGGTRSLESPARLVARSEAAGFTDLLLTREPG